MNKLLAAIAVTAALATSVAFAQSPPVDNIGRRHPNLEAAQDLSTQAFQRIVAAQQSNEFDMGGHAQKAKMLLDQANRELRMAASFANAHGHP